MRLASLDDGCDGRPTDALCRSCTRSKTARAIFSGTSRTTLRWSTTSARRAQILLNVYGVKVGATVEAETLEKLVGLRLASLRPAPRPVPSEQERPSDVAPALVKPRSPEPRPAPGRNQRRTRGREVRLQLLYQVEQNPGFAAAHIEQFLQRGLQEPRLLRLHPLSSTA